MSTMPGSTHLAVASMTLGQPVSSSGVAETSATTPSRMPRWRTAEGAPVPSNQRPPRMIVSNVMTRL
jgi:hypothetical protein